ncbi:hypothetical protein TBLA_0E02780 [Henningerozyma blattae CBS 6284]|uniref:FAD dependent oxidoreductase domain-containing protein n=1 Tax=Henningerozyma blattae (strain ATCC 34711 / CBS 6284 / DSM 70876 / NBRC 10599 / NRRL Y-10934 / UCD 77-7) TaxID=1071380 RepID=I2H4N2_HENB6|nr:hypothetical protein TBLA_0E02780 [Tetrapisispora blattae CBS 6284]CCH61334.1 hypothetical protein TBLA_0E02780 [Tetrapisispora blattae CBS 6284]
MEFQLKDDLKYTHTSTTQPRKDGSIPKNAGKKNIIIVGGGIIGACTAYYLTRHPNFDPSLYHITIFEATSVACGSSGKAGGLLAAWAFPEQIVPLSFDLHQELSDLYDGEENWGYRRLNIISLESNMRRYKKFNKNLMMNDSFDNDSIDNEKELEELRKINQKRREEDKKKPFPSKRKGYFFINDDEDEDEDDENGDSQRNEAQIYESQQNFEESHTPKSSPGDMLNEEVEQQQQQQQQQTHTPQEELPQQIDQSEHSRTPENPSMNPLPPQLNWIKTQGISNWSALGDTDTTAQIHPFKFTHFILQKAMETGAVDLISAKVTRIIKNSDNSVSGVAYVLTENGKILNNNNTSNNTTNNSNITPNSQPSNETSPNTSTNEPSSIDFKNELEMVDAENVILTMGPWTSKLLPNCPIYGLRAHSITIQPSVEEISPFAIFTELKIEDSKYFSPEIYPRTDEVYVCGEGDTMVELPELASEIVIEKEKCDELYYYVSKLAPTLSEGYIKTRQACYLPVLNVSNSSGPLIGETNLKNLFVASGHSCWGINNAPATGKLLAELLLEGEASSADISALNPTLFFTVD